MNPIYPFFLAFLSALFFGSATPISKVLLDDLTAFQLAGLLYLGAAAGVLVILAKEGRFRFPWQMGRVNGLRLAGAVFFGGFLGPVALLLGLQLASASSVSLWLNLEMVATAVLGHFLFKDHLTTRSWLAAGGVLLAASLLAVGEGAAGFQAGFLVALACLFWGIDNHLTALIDDITPAQSTFWKGLAAGSTNFLIGITLAPIIVSGSSLLVALAVGVVAYGLSIVLYITSAQNLGAIRSQLVFSSAPFWGVLLSIVFLGEKLYPLQILAAAIFIASILTLLREQHQHQHIHEAITHEHLHRHDDGHHQHPHPQDEQGLHSHTHNHQPIKHAHPHWPDLHHRHQHKPGG